MPEEPASDAPETPETPEGGVVLTADEQDLLGKVLKLLVNISRPPHLAVARRERYTGKEHKEGSRERVVTHSKRPSSKTSSSNRLKG